VTMIAGVIEAQVSFVGTKTYERKRPLPPKPAEPTKPKVGLSGSGSDAGGLGLRITF
jgi:hypothetical protein